MPDANAEAAPTPEQQFTNAVIEWLGNHLDSDVAWTRSVDAAAAAQSAPATYEAAVADWTIVLASSSYPNAHGYIGGSYGGTVYTEYTTKFVMTIVDPDGDVRGVAEAGADASPLAKLYADVATHHERASRTARRDFMTTTGIPVTSRQAPRDGGVDL